MRWLSDDAVARLRAGEDLPEPRGGKYRVLQCVARGGMGAVYLAEDLALGRRVALKTLDLPDPTGELEARMLREAQVVARLEHPGIVPIHDFGKLADGRVFYAMKYVQGERLDARLSKVSSIADRLRIFLKICDAVAFAHAHGVIHRDLKPENIMIGPFGEVLVMDWGLAKVLSGPAAHEVTPEEDARKTLPPTALARTDGPRPTAHGVILGTPGYMAPEQARGKVEELGPRADVYALGAILRFLLTGRPPDAAPSVGASEPGPSGGARGRQLERGKPRPLVAICAKAMAAEPSARYASAQGLAADVARYLDGLPVAAYPENLFAKAGRLMARHRTAVILVVVYLLARVLVFFLSRR